MTAVDVPSAERSRTRLHWYHEVAFVVVFYAIYSAVRNLFGSATVGPDVAYRNARHVIRLEEAMGLYHEETIQDWFLPLDWFMRFWNIFYGTTHFIVTIGALVWMFLRMPERYSRWRTTLACTTALALIGFAAYPLMPPRLLNDFSEFGAGALATRQYGFVDTLASVGGLWSFDSGAMKEISNQYAAMPSLHCAWAAWCSFVLWPLVRRPWVRALVVIYPFTTLFCIIVTANHYWLDGVGGLLTLAVGYWLAGILNALWPRLRSSIPAPLRPPGPLPLHPSDPEAPESRR